MSSHRQIQIIAHRGASHDAPENTLAAVCLAWEQGADAVEVDVRLTRDQRIVAIHDADTRRTAGVKWKVAYHSLEELGELDVGRWKHKRWIGERIPTLESILALLPQNKRIFIEVKCGAEIIPELEIVLRASKVAPGQITFIGFSLHTVALLKRAFPAMEAAWITGLRRMSYLGRWIRPGAVERKVKLAGVDGVDLDHRRRITAKLVSRLHQAGLKLYVWTVDSPLQARRLAMVGVDGLTTNRPGWLITRM